MAVDHADLIDQLVVESRGLTEVLGGLADDSWARASAAAGWSIADQITHLAFFDDAAVTAIEDPDGFRAQARELTAAGMDFPDRLVARFSDLSPREVAAWFAAGRRNLIEVLAAASPRDRMPWYGPDMSVASCVTARLMETWAHGRDVYDALGIAHPPSRALRSIAHLGVSTFAFTHRNNGLPVPTTPVRVALTGPGGDQWTWGPATATDTVTGPAEDFVFVVTQRMALADTALNVVGEVADTWMRIAQAYAGPPGAGRMARRGDQTGVKP